MSKRPLGGACEPRVIHSIMRKILIFSALFLLAPHCHAQLSTDQKLSDFQDLVAAFSKHYAFYEWKLDALHFDGLSLTPWVDRIRNSKDDLAFWEICAQYVASYQDSHSSFLLPSNYTARLGFGIDIYEGKVLIDSIDPKVFTDPNPAIRVGDELVAIDGKPVAGLITDMASLVGDGNPPAGRRFAASLLVSREQDLVPRAHEVSNSALLLIHHQGGATDSIAVPWIVDGRPYLYAGPVPAPRLATTAVADDSDAGAAPWPSYMDRARKRQQFHLPAGRFLAGFGRLKPVFDMPAGFLPRLGQGRFDQFFTGTFTAGGFQIGYLRAPTFEFFAGSTLQKEIAFFDSSTDGLIVDVTRNPGGFGCTSEGLARLLQPNGFHSLGVSIRATWFDVLGAQQDLDDAIAFGGTDDEIAELRTSLQYLQDAYKQNRGMTLPLPLCGPSQDIAPLVTKTGTIAYTKPIMILTDELTASAAEIFAAIMQDTGRAMIYGARTDGAGGAVDGLSAGQYGETGVSLAVAIIVRKAPVVTMEFPAAPYIENIGVRPEVTASYMTVDNLLNNGKTFVDGFTAAMVDYLTSKKQ